jgi:hypothetical protein
MEWKEVIPLRKWFAVFGMVSPIILAITISCEFEPPTLKEGTIRVEMVDASSSASQSISKSVSAVTTPPGGDGAPGGIPTGDGNTYSPIDLNTVDKILVTIERVDVSKTEEGWETIATEPKEYDLARMAKEGVKEVLGEAKLSEGTYTQIRLIVSQANKIILSDGSTHDLFIPSGTKTGVKLTGEFEVTGGETTNIILDFDTRQSVVQRGIGDTVEYLLIPVIRVLSVTR